MTLAKWVGTEMEGGEPMTSWTLRTSNAHHRKQGDSPLYTCRPDAGWVHRGVL